tara:strand:+ start:51 stop:314 length:264 start_codon:yes stop_codon:yes gene_type:complete
MLIGAITGCPGVAGILDGILKSTTLSTGLIELMGGFTSIVFVSTPHPTTENIANTRLDITVFIALFDKQKNEKPPLKGASHRRKKIQ